MRLSFVGDVCLKDIPPESFVIDPEIGALLRSSDVSVGNLECPLTTAELPVPYKAVVLKAPPAPHPVLDLFDAFTLANNHILDYQAAGLLETIEFLERSGKRCVGAGANLERALRPVTFEEGSRRVALLAFSHWNGATRGSAGTAPDRAGMLIRRVRETSRQGFFVVVLAHWNYEYIDVPAPFNRRLARKLVDAGADLVVGSHPHVVQGSETYRGKLIFHSLGNFVFETASYPEEEKSDTRLGRTFILTVDLDGGAGYRTAITPVATDGTGIRLLAGPEREGFLERLTRLSRVLEDEKLAARTFYRSCVQGVGKADRGIGGMIKQHGPMYLLSRLHRLRLHDLQIALRMALHRLRGPRPE